MRNGKAPQEQLRLHRFVVILMMFVLLCAVFVARLVQMQLTDYDGSYTFNRLAQTERIVKIKAVRGMICDRNGEVLVSTRERYHLQTDDAFPTDDATCNKILSELLTLLDSQNVACDGTQTMLPYTYENGTVQLGTRTEKQQAALDAFLERHELDISDDEPSLLYELCQYFGLIDAQTDTQTADWGTLYRLAQLRYDIDVCQNEETSYVFHRDCDMTLVSAVQERKWQGLDFGTDMVRVYHYPGYLSQVLGRVGKIQSGDEEYYSSLGYAMDAVVGVDGVEELYETTLCGTDGEMRVIEDANGEVLSTEIIREAVPGRNVYLTIDIDLQIKAEESLKNTIQTVAANGAATETAFDGEDANAGALCAVNPNDGSILAMASYPTYNLSTYSQDYAVLSQDENRPYLNRVLQGTYEPGSTFKPAVAAAALEYGVIDANTIIRDQGVYRYYENYQPACWIYNRYPGSTHGDENVVDALIDSCNYFFYETGRLLGIERMNAYAKTLGLGSETGVELKESTGSLAGPEEREAAGRVWYPGDTLQAAIGQSDNLFTPLQMCMYISTLCNGGTRYQAHLYHQTVDYNTGEVLDAYTTNVLGKAQISSEHLGLIKSAMSTIATAVFPQSTTTYTVGGKTGTAQVGANASENALYAAFAPLDNPQIVAYCVIEHGSTGGNAGIAIRSVLDSYFASNG